MGQKRDGNRARKLQKPDQRARRPRQPLRLSPLQAAPGGRGGIRTHEALASLPLFESGSFNHSDTLPPRSIAQRPRASQAACALVVRWQGCWFRSIAAGMLSWRVARERPFKHRPAGVRIQMPDTITPDQVAIAETLDTETLARTIGSELGVRPGRAARTLELLD